MDMAVDENEIHRLRAQVRSIGHINPGTYAKPEERPDDTEMNSLILQSESLSEALFDIADKYGADVTNNMERWQDGRYIRDVGSFIEDIINAVLRHESDLEWYRNKKENVE